MRLLSISKNGKSQWYDSLHCGEYGHLKTWNIRNVGKILHVYRDRGRLVKFFFFKLHLESKLKKMFEKILARISLLLQIDHVWPTKNYWRMPCLYFHGGMANVHAQMSKKCQSSWMNSTSITLMIQFAFRMRLTFAYQQVLEVILTISTENSFHHSRYVNRYMQYVKLKSIYW